MNKTKNDLPQIADEQKPAVFLVAAGVLFLLVTSGMFGVLMDLIFGVFGAVIGGFFGVFGALIGAFFGVFGAVMGAIFGTFGALMGIFFGTMAIWLPALLIIGGLMIWTRNSRGEKVKNQIL